MIGTIDAELRENRRIFDHAHHLASHVELLQDIRQLAIPAGFLALLNAACEHAQNGDERLQGIRLLIEEVSAGKHLIVDPEEIYEHDRRCIEKLRQSQFYYATCVENDTPGFDEEGNQDDPDTFAFNAYLRAQEDAAVRGVDVQRLYILKNPTSPQKRLRKQLDLLKRKRVRVWLLDSSTMRKDNKKSRDFVLIDKHAVGVGDPPVGRMERSIYYYNVGEHQSQQYDEYLAHFKNLLKSAVEYGVDGAG